MLYCTNIAINLSTIVDLLAKELGHHEKLLDMP